MQPVSASDTIFDFFGGTNTYVQRIRRSENKIFKYFLNLRVGEVRLSSRKETLLSAEDGICIWHGAHAVPSIPSSYTLTAAYQCFLVSLSQHASAQQSVR